MVQFFAANETLEFLRDDSDAEHEARLRSVPGLEALVAQYAPGWSGAHAVAAMEFVLHGLAEHNLIGRTWNQGDAVFADLMSGLFRSESEEEG